MYSPRYGVAAWHAEKNHQHPWELDQLLIELEQIAPVNVVVEIGNFTGDSLRVWRTALSPECMIGVQDTDELRPETAAELDVIAITGRSQDYTVYRHVLDALADRPIDFLFIDGDHLYDAVKRDWELYAPLVRSGGIIVLDDAAIEDNETVEVFKFWPEIVHDHFTKLLWDGGVECSTGTGIVWK